MRYGFPNEVTHFRRNIISIWPNLATMMRNNKTPPQLLIHTKSIHRQLAISSKQSQADHRPRRSSRWFSLLKSLTQKSSWHCSQVVGCCFQAKPCHVLSLSRKLSLSLHRWVKERIKQRLHIFNILLLNTGQLITDTLMYITFQKNISSICTAQ